MKSFTLSLRKMKLCTYILHNNNNNNFIKIKLQNYIHFYARDNKIIGIKIQKLKNSFKIGMIAKYVQIAHGTAGCT